MYETLLGEIGGGGGRIEKWGEGVIRMVKNFESDAGIGAEIFELALINFLRQKVGGRIIFLINNNSSSSSGSSNNK